MVKKFLQSIWLEAFLLLSLGMFSIGFLADSISQYLPDELAFLDPLDSPLNNFFPSDYVFSQQSSKIDTNITIVNGAANRLEVAKQIAAIHQHHPKVLGITFIFSSYSSSSVTDETLTSALALYNSKGLILPANVSGMPKDSIKMANSAFRNFGTTGVNDFYNMFVIDTLQEYFSEDETARVFKPQYEVKNSKFNHFGVEVVKQYDINAYRKFLERKNEYEVMYYRGNNSKFRYLDSNDLKSSRSKNYIENKIVLLGICDTSQKISRASAKFFSPLNSGFLNKTVPDMYYVEGTANVISMILQGNFITSISASWSIFISQSICFLITAFFLFIRRRKGQWYGVTVLLAGPLVSTVLVLFSIWLFSQYCVNLNLKSSYLEIAFSAILVEIWYNIKESSYAGKFLVKLKR